MKILFGLLKGCIAISSFFAMYFASFFWIGSREEWKYQVENHFWTFFLGRFFLVLIIGSIFLLLSWLLNRLFQKRIAYKKKYVLFELLAVIVISALLVLKTIYKNG